MNKKMNEKDLELLKNNINYKGDELGFDFDKYDFEKFEKELTTLINNCSLENLSDTPDFILSKYLVNCLKIFSETSKMRDKWYNFKPWENYLLKDKKINCNDCKDNNICKIRKMAIKNNQEIYNCGFFEGDEENKC